MVKKKSNLFQKLVVEFEGEEGVDVGALTKEYFLKYYETVRKDLFETLISETSLILKMSGCNLFPKSSDSPMGSLLQEGPPFPCVHLWCYAMITQKSNEEIVGLISKKNTQN